METLKKKKWMGLGWTMQKSESVNLKKRSMEIIQIGKEREKRF